jgi:hypothetical protein
MNRIRSTIGESNFAVTGQRRFVVSNEDEAQVPPQPPSQLTPEMATTLRRQAQEHQEQIENRNLSDARRRIDIITGLGRKTRDVPVDTSNGTVVFCLRTLKTFEQNCLAQVVEQSERLTATDGRMIFAPTSLSKIRIEALSHSLYLIDNQSIDIILGTANAPYEEQVLARKDLIDEMDHALISHLFNNYESLTQETYDGYIPKTVEEAKEVAETISKSGQDT